MMSSKIFDSMSRANKERKATIPQSTESCSYQSKYNNDSSLSKTSMSIPQENHVEIKESIEDDEISVKPPQNHCKEKCPKPLYIFWVYIARQVLLLAFLYFFICSLDLLSSSFRLLSGKLTGVLAKAEVLENPVVGLMIGIVITVLVQSSSTSTSITITMVAAGILTTSRAAYIVMGANVGTSVTNTLVAMGQIGDRKQFRRAFAGATIHDVFNWLSVFVLLPLEAICQMLQRLTKLIVDSMNLVQYKDAKQDLLKTVTKPLTKLIIQLDKKILQDPEKVVEAETIMKVCCNAMPNVTLAERLSYGNCTCDYAFSGVTGKWSDPVVGAVLLAISLVILFVCLYGLVKILNNVLEGRIALILKKFINSDRLGPFAGYLAILLGAGLTILVQSSSVFTSALTPLVGTGFLELRRMFPLTLGANIGTCVTGILAALASDSDTLQYAMQTAMIHLFFNLFGILIWYPLPFMRYVPIHVAKLLGKTSSRYRWFPVFYIIMMFLVIPLVVFALSIWNTYIAIVFAGLVAFIVIVIGIIKTIQRKRPNWLPKKLRNWKWLPLPLRSLEPYERVFCTCCLKHKCCCQDKSVEDLPEIDGFDNVACVPDTDVEMTKF